MGESPFQINGSAVVAIAGRNCVAMGCDTRLGVKFTTISNSFQKVFKMQDNILLGLTGLATDILTLFVKKSQKNPVQTQNVPAAGK